MLLAFISLELILADPEVAEIAHAQEALRWPAPQKLRGCMFKNESWLCAGFCFGFYGFCIDSVFPAFLFFSCFSAFPGTFCHLLTNMRMVILVLMMMQALMLLMIKLVVLMKLLLMLRLIIPFRIADPILLDYVSRRYPQNRSKEDCHGPHGL